MLYIINKNKLIKIKVCPWEAVGPTNILNSLWSWFIINVENTAKRLGWIQNTQGSTNKPKNIANQLRGRLNDATGSKIENKLVVIIISNSMERSG